MASMSRLVLSPRIFIRTTVPSPNSSPFKKSITRTINNCEKSMSSSSSLSAVNGERVRCAAAVGLSTANMFSPPKCSAAVSSFSLSNTSMMMNHNYHQLNPCRNQHIRNFSSLNMPLQTRLSTLVHHNAMAPLKNRRFISSNQITKNMTLYTKGQYKPDVDTESLEFKKPSGNPLVLMMAWLMAKQKHLKKYAEIYTELGFDVAVIHITPWQLLWPTKGTQIVAAETLKFLENNKSYAPIIVHGFSVGAYQFGEMMLQMSRDMTRYTPILDRMVCQIWDSAADITEIPQGLPRSIFPKNPRMQNALRNYTLYHLKTFHNQATIHYMRSSQMFHSTLLKKPAMFFVSDDDVIGPPASNQAVRENWERANINVTFHCWKKSQHAAHLIKHREEYLDLLFKHLETVGILEAVGVKTRAKL